MLRETEEDRKNQTRLMKAFSAKTGLEYQEFSRHNNKYNIDGFLHRGRNNEVAAWVECKWYSGHAHLLLNVPKFTELVSLSELTKADSYLLFREYERWGWILIRNRHGMRCHYNTKLMGGTPPGREPNDDDLEPLIQLNRADIVWGI